MRMTATRQDDEMTRLGRTSRVKERSRKQYGIETHTWREEIQARAAEHGLGRDDVARLLARGRATPARDVGDLGLAEVGDVADLRDRDVGVLADRLAGASGLTERANTFDGLTVLREFAQAAGQGARVATIRGQADCFAGRPDVLDTRGGEMTTIDLVACERRLIGSALGRVAEGCAVIDDRELDRVIDGANRTLTVEQARVVRAVATSGHGVSVVEALAGTGKTYVAGVLGSLYEAYGYRVIGLAPTARAARELTDEARVSASTIDRALIEVEQLGLELGDRSVILLDEAGMAPTRLTARLLEHAAGAGAKVVAIGDSGQLPSVLAGGWLQAVGERIGAVELTEVMRQRDAGERRALAALHHGLPDRYIGWATVSDRIEVVGADQIADQAVGEWVAAAAEQPSGQAVMICRDNDTRGRLNQLARTHRREAGELGAERCYGATPIPVGDRVICRNNDARVGVDNGTRGTVRHVDGAKVVLETDSGVVRELPASYVADHVEHAYCLTGHGMQGGTVERAVVVASPQDLTAGWSYSALSRARGATRLLIADSDRHQADRAEHAPLGQRTDHSSEAVIARVARRMRVRDDEDLAVSQPAGREDDPALAWHRSVVGSVVQEAAAHRAEPGEPASLGRLKELRERIGRLRLALGVLPTRPLARLREVDANARGLRQTRSEHEQRLAALRPPGRRFGRLHDPDAQQRAFLQTAIEIDDRALADVAADRARLQRELGDPDQVRSERDGIEKAITGLKREYHDIRDTLAQRTIDREPRWLAEALGHRPDDARERHTWDRAAWTVTRFRLDHDINDQHPAVGPQPIENSEVRRDWQAANTALEHAQRQLERRHPSHDRGIDLGLD